MVFGLTLAGRGSGPGGRCDAAEGGEGRLPGLLPWTQGSNLLAAARKKAQWNVEV